jgi:hypothetical protein
MRWSNLLLVIGLLCASQALAEVYKWVDADGTTHFGDCPPPDCVFEEIEIPAGPSEEEIEAAEERLRNALEARRARDAEAGARKEAESLEERQLEAVRAERLQKCAEAIYQLALLHQKRRVFRERADGSRLYLENEDRPGEIARIERSRDEFCSDEPEDRKEQIERAEEMSVALSRRCAAARETLERMQQPGADPEAEKLQDYRTYVEAFCPAIESGHLWLGDWIVVRKAQ